MPLELTAAAVVGLVIKLVIDRLRKRVTGIDGDLVLLMAAVLGYGATYIPDVGSYAGWTDRLVGAIELTGVSHLWAELTRRLNFGGVKIEP